MSEYGTWNWQTWKYEESETSAKYFRQRLSEIPETDTIELHINSWGGSVKEGVAIYNLLKQKKCKEIVAYVDGFAYSIASIILQAADRRIMSLGTSIMIHNMWLMVQGNAQELRKAADDLEVLMESNRKIYLSKINITEDELIAMLEAETYLTPQQAVEMGFADEVFDTGVAVESGDMLEQMQLQLSQMRKRMAAQKSLKEEMQQFFKLAQKQSETDDDDETDDTSDGDETDDTSDGDETDDTSDGDETDDTSDGDETDDTSDGDETDDTSDDDQTDDTSDGDETDDTSDNDETDNDNKKSAKQKGTHRMAKLLAIAAAQNLGKERK